jgi:hypothetical protein
MKQAYRLLLFIFLVAGCAPATVASTPQVVPVYVTSAAEPWLTELYACAAHSSVALSSVLDVQSAEIVLRIGEPEFLTTPAFEIDTEEIWIVAHRETTIQNTSLEELQALFAGRGDPSVQVWVYTSGEDVQRVFDQAVMSGRSMSPSARVAANPQHMLEALESDRQAIGILPLTWSMKMNGSAGLYHVATAPVLAITRSQPSGAVEQMIACLQK